MSHQKDKNEPGRFLGEGVSFRAKLIGVLEVPEARGDRMCQEALADLKMAIRAAGEHKLRIQVHVAIDGLRLRDDKTGDSLYHHPVHKISFIAQDMTDSRAFGYIFGSPDTGHRFFGIKTDKAASQVVIAMRDLFQVVFELKKKEVEMAKQQLEGKSITSSSIIRHIPSISIDNKIKPQLPQNDASTSAPKTDTAEGDVAELVDLEQELSSLRRGLTQVEGLTPLTDPFGDSFTVTQKGLLPPPPSGTTARGRVSATSSRTIFSPTKTLPFDLPVSTDFENAAPKSLVENLSEPVVPPSQPAASSLLDVFTDLDPLGTGRSKPYVDKKLFFQELKNPPKKVLKDLVPSTQIENKAIVTEPQSDYGAATTMTSLSRHSGGTVAIAKPSNSMFSSHFFSSDPFAEADPFDNADPFLDPFKDDPFTNMSEFAKPSLLREEFKKMPSLSIDSKSESVESGKNVFNGPLQVTLPPEPAPKSPRLQRQSTDTSTIRQRPHGRLSANEGASPPPPLPPKKPAEPGRPPPPPPHEDSAAPPIPKPSRKREHKLHRRAKPRRPSITTNSSSDEYLAPAPPPLPTARRFDITLSQLLTLSMDELSVRLHVPVATLSSMTLPQLTDYLRSYLAADNDRPVRDITVSEKLKYLEEYLNKGTQKNTNSFQHIHVESAKSEREKSMSSVSPLATLEKPVVSAPAVAAVATTTAPVIATVPVVATAPVNATAPVIATAPVVVTAPVVADFKAKFEDDFAPSVEPGEFVADFDNFEKKASASYDRYAVFREIQEQELKSKSILDPIESPNGDLETHEEDKDEPSVVKELAKASQEAERKEDSKSPLKSLDELTLDSFNMFRKSVSPKPAQIDAKIEDIKSVMKNLTIEKSRRSVSPRENNINEMKMDDNSDRYAALREITITEPPDEFESLPPDVPKERKRSDEKSDGFDNSDFFDCIDNSSLSFTHVEDAFRKSPVVKEKVEERKIEEGKVVIQDKLPVRDLQPPPRLSAGSISDVASASSPDTKDKTRVDGNRTGDRWSMLGASPWSSDSRDSDLCRPRRRHPQDVSKARPIVASSSSSREVSPWEEEVPPRHHHHRDRDRERESRHNSSQGSRECLDSGSGREKNRRESRDRDRERDRDLSRSGRESARDRKDSGSGRDRRDIKDYKDKRDRRSRERDRDIDRTYSRERDYRDSRSRDRQKDYRDKDRDRHVKSRHSYDEDEDYSDGCPSGRSSPRDRWPDSRWRRDERNYGSLGWRESRRRNDNRLPEDPPDRRYTSTLNYSRRSGDRAGRSERDRDRERAARRRRDPRRDPRDTRDPRDPRDPADKRHYASLEATRFSFDHEETTASPSSAGPNTRSQWWWQSSDSPGAFEDDFTSASTPRHRNTSIAEEEETELPPLRPKQVTHKDIKKSESVNIFTRECDPFEGDAFFACTGSDKAAKRENWPGDFQGFDRA